MMNEQIFSKLTPIFREVFDDDALVPVPEMTAKDVDTWDSLAHIRLIVAVEGHFKITFTSAEISDFATVGDLVAKIKIKLGG